MNKKFLRLSLLVLVSFLIASCKPELPLFPLSGAKLFSYCEDLYLEQLEVYPDLPKAFIGVCVNFIQTGEVTGGQALCPSEDAREALGDYLGIDNMSLQECVAYMRTYE